MASVCAKCGAPLASSTAHCYSCGAPASSKMTDDTLNYKFVLVLLVAGSIAAVCGLHLWRTMHSNGNSITISLPKRSSDFGLGVSVYPGASSGALTISSTGIGNPVLRMKKGNTESVRAMYTTHDSESRVLQYYQDTLGPDAITKRGLLSTTVTLTKVSVVGTDSVVVTLIPYTQSHGLLGKTQITIVHTKTTTP